MTNTIERKELLLVLCTVFF